MRSGVKESAERATQLRRLTFEDNFESAEVELSIAASTEVTITNPFRRSGRIPSKWIIVDDRGSGILKKGSATWTVDLLSFQNVSSLSTVDATVLLLR